jgi:hypothetical protein
MIQQPIKIEQALINYVLIDRSLILDYDRKIVFIYAKRIDSPAMSFSRRIGSVKNFV